MTPTLLAIYAAIEAAKARIEAMKAENTHRLSVRESIAYGAEAFNYEAAELDRLSINARDA